MAAVTAIPMSCRSTKTFSAAALVRCAVTRAIRWVRAVRRPIPYVVAAPVTANRCGGQCNPDRRPNGDLYGYVASDGQLLYGQVQDDDDPFGGNVLIEGSAELLFPLPFIKDQSQIRTGFFLDAGNVYDTDC